MARNHIQGKSGNILDVDESGALQTTLKGRTDANDPVSARLSNGTDFVDDDHPLPQKIVSNKMESVRYYVGNKIGSEPDGSWEIRDTTSRSFVIPHASANIMEQSLAIWNNLDQGLRVRLRAVFDFSGFKSFSRLWEEVWGAGGIPSDGRVVLAPEKGLYIADASTVIYDVIELRGPYTDFFLDVQADDTPTSGDWQLRITRRF